MKSKYIPITLYQKEIDSVSVYVYSDGTIEYYAEKQIVNREANKQDKDCIGIWKLKI